MRVWGCLLPSGTAKGHHAPCVCKPCCCLGITCWGRRKPSLCIWILQLLSPQQLLPTHHSVPSAATSLLHGLCRSLPLSHWHLPAAVCFNTSPQPVPHPAPRPRCAAVLQPALWWLVSQPLPSALGAGAAGSELQALPGAGGSPHTA